MLLASLDHAEEDVAARLAAEARIEARRILHDLEKALSADGALLDPGERQRIEAAVAAVRREMEGTEHARITAAIGDLDAVSAGFAQRRMDAAIQRALAGHSVEEFR